MMDQHVVDYYYYLCTYTTQEPDDWFLDELYEYEMI